MAEYNFDAIIHGQDPSSFVKILLDIASNDVENKPISLLGHGPSCGPRSGIAWIGSTTPSPR